MGLAMLAIQALLNNKYLGYALSLALLAADPLLVSLGFEHRLYRYAALPALKYSDISGYGGMLPAWCWLALYWLTLALVLLILAQASQATGAATWRERWRPALRNLRGSSGQLLACCLAAFVLTGGWIYYSTNILNRYVDSQTAMEARADYEKRYRRYLDLPQPSLVAVSADVAFFPEQRRVRIQGHYELKNKGVNPLETLLIQNDLSKEALVLTRISGLPPHTQILDDARLGFKLLKLEQALAPGASLGMDFSVEVSHPGFSAANATDGIQLNGSLFTSENYFPRLGYNPSLEISDQQQRRQHGLGETHGLAARNDSKARTANYWKQYGYDADFIAFDTTVSTSADQAAIAPGSLIASWEKDGRRYFHFRAEQPILPLFSYQSGRWEQRSADWKGLPITVYYDRKHAYNVDNMLRGAQSALDYYTEHFGPYPLGRLAITEFPLYQSYARSLPGLIPFSESLGFINDLRGSDSVDHVFYVTAHEVAHQWWGDQVIAANVQGNGMLTETLAEYSALMVMEKIYGREKTRHILRYDLEQYLEGRGKETRGEPVLAQAENQTYVDYRKGSLAMYRLREEIGEAAVNRALRSFLEQQRYRSRPYPSTLELLDCLRAQTPADKHALLSELFEHVVLYDNRMLDASTTPRPDGLWDVTLNFSLAKMKADAQGKETAVAYDESVDIAIFGPGTGENRQVLLHEKHRLNAGVHSLRYIVSGKPEQAGVDPYLILLERHPDDNLKPVRIEEATKNQQGSN
jgi:hypothetical protein